jgi:hypothetical protein
MKCTVHKKDELPSKPFNVTLSLNQNEISLLRKTFGLNETIPAILVEKRLIRAQDKSELIACFNELYCLMCEIVQMS